MEVKDIFNEMNFDNRIELEEMPELDLYMDQVIQLFENKLSSLKRNDEEKILTKTMINNYAKGKLLLPIKNKKYTKEHLIMMAFIYNLKGALSINDIKISLDEVIANYDEEKASDLRDLYNDYLYESKEDEEIFKSSIKEKIEELDNRICTSENLPNDYKKNFLLLCSLVNMSNMYRRASEKLIDEFFTKNNE